MKKIIAIVLVLAMVLSITACASDVTEPTATETPVVTAAPATASPEATTSPTTSPEVEATETPTTTWISLSPTTGGSSSSVTIPTWDGTEELTEDEYQITLSDSSTAYSFEDSSYTGILNVYTNGTINDAITIDMGNATINYYGQTTGAVTIASGAHTFNMKSGAETGALTIAGGNAVIESGSTQASIAIDSTNTTSVSVGTNARVTVTSADMSGATITTTDSASPTIKNDAEGTVVVTQDNSSPTIDGSGSQATYLKQESNENASVADKTTSATTAEVSDAAVIIPANASVSTGGESNEVTGTVVVVSPTTDEYTITEITADIVIPIGYTATISSTIDANTYAISNYGTVVFANSGTITDYGTIKNYGTFEVGTQATFELALAVGGKILLGEGTFNAPAEINKSTYIMGVGSTRLDSNDITTLFFVNPMYVKTDDVVLTIQSLDLDADAVSSKFATAAGIISLGYTGTDTYDNIEFNMIDCQVIKETTSTLYGSVFLDATVDAKINIKNSYIYGKYAIYCATYTDSDNRRGDSHDVKNTIYTITNSTLEGWSTGNMRGENTIYTISDSILIGENEYSGTSNSYSTFVLTDGAINGTYTMNNCIITATNTGDQEQNCFSFQYGANGNTLYLNDCIFEMYTSNNVQAAVVSSSSGGTLTYPATENNAVVLNGVEYELSYENVNGQYTLYQIVDDELMQTYNYDYISYRIYGIDVLYIYGSYYDILNDDLQVIIDGALYEVIDGSLVKYNGIPDDGNDYSSVPSYYCSYENVSNQYTIVVRDSDWKLEYAYVAPDITELLSQTGTITIYDSGSIDLASCTDSTFTINCNLILNAEINLSSIGTLVVSETGSITINDTGKLLFSSYTSDGYYVCSDFINNGTIVNNSVDDFGGIYGAGCVFYNNGYYSGTSTLSNTMMILCTETFVGLQQLVANSAITRLSRPIYVEPSEEFVVSSALTIPETILIDITGYGGSVVVNAPIIANGDFELWDISVINNSSITVNGDFYMWYSTIENNGSVDLSGASSITFDNYYYDTNNVIEKTDFVFGNVVPTGTYTFTPSSD